MAARFQEPPSTIHELIQKSELISEGSPARYRLLTAKSNLEKDGSVRIWTFGQQCINMQNKILLMVGETGTGKTTQINAMVNCILGVKFTDEVWFEITEEEGDNPISVQSKSRTSKVTVYKVFAKDNPICLTIIDTPGYGDTRGTSVDEQIAENLHKLFHSDTGVKEIDAVCLVVKATVNRLTDRQHYIFDAVLSLFGKDVQKNIFIFITHSDGFPSTNVFKLIKTAGIPCRKGKANEPVCYLFNNHQVDKRSKKYRKALQISWELTEGSLSDFFTSLEAGNRKSLEQTGRVLTESKRFKVCITKLQNHIHSVDCKAEELAQTQKSLKENKRKIARNENFTFTVNTYYKEKVPIENASWWDRMATSCSVCEENCHEYRCWSTLNTSWCEVMKNEHCTVCTGKCHYTKHVKENKKYVRHSKEIIVTFDSLKELYESSNKSASDIKFDKHVFEDVKNQFESNKKEEEEMIIIEKRLKEELIKHEKETNGLVEEAYDAIVKLSEISLNPHTAFNVQGLDFLIPLAQDTGRVFFAEKLKELRKMQPEAKERVNAVTEYARIYLKK